MNISKKIVYLDHKDLFIFYSFLMILNIADEN